MPTSFTFLKQTKPPPASTAKSLSAKYPFVFLERNVSTATCGITSLHSTDGFDYHYYLKINITHYSY